MGNRESNMRNRHLVEDCISKSIWVDQILTGANIGYDVWPRGRPRFKEMIKGIMFNIRSLLDLTFSVG